MKLVFCGTPEFAVPILRAVLDATHEVSLVLTQPDRPAGRKMELHAPPVKLLAERHGLSPSGLARKAGLSPTVFNPSKRLSRKRKRWPSTENRRGSPW